MDRLRGQRYLVVVVIGNYWFAALDLRDWLPSRHAPQGSLLPSNPYRPRNVLRENNILLLPSCHDL